MNLETKTRTRLFIGLKTSEHKTYIHPQEVITVIKNHVEAGTFYEGKGLWMGETENSLVFECVELEDNLRADETGIDSVQQLKELLEREFDQDSVMVEQSRVETAF